MIRQGRPEDVKAIYGLRKIQVGLNSNFQELYFQHQFEHHNVIVNEVNSQIKASIQMDYYPLMLRDCRVMCSVLTGQFYDGKSPSYYTQLLDECLKQLQCTTLFTAVFGAKNEKFAKLGFEPVYTSRVYDIRSSQLNRYYDHSVDRRFNLSELRDLYNSFVSHFDGYMLRDPSYWVKLMDSYTFLNYFLAVYRDDQGSASGYMVYHVEKNTLIIDEIIYTSGLALLRLLAYGSKIKPQMRVYVSQSEDLALALEGSRFKLETRCWVKVNDAELYERLYGQRFTGAAEAFLSTEKPLWISRGY